MAERMGATFVPMGTKGTLGRFVEQSGTTNHDWQIAKFPAVSVARRVMT